MAGQYNFQVIRQLLSEAFKAQEINALAFEHFREVHNDFTEGMAKSRMISLLMEWVERQGQLETLLTEIKLRNPSKYGDYADQIYSDPMPDSIPELEQLIAKERQLLLQYEEMEQQERHTRRRLRLQESLEDARVAIANYESRIAEIRAANTPAPRPQVQETVFIANVPYGLETELYGREQELALLDDWFHRDRAHPLLAVIGLGGQGKSALTWQWQQKLREDKLAPPLVIWWSFYEADGTVERFASRLLRHFNEKPEEYVSLRNKVDRVVEHLQETPALLVLDGAERLLRAYSGMGAAYQGDAETADIHAASLERQQLRGCVDPAAGILLTWLAEPGLMRARTLLTSRLFPQELAGRGGLGLAGVRRHDLTGLNNEAAYALFQSLGIETTRAEVQAACEPLGYHPLSLRLLAQAVRYSPTAPNDLRAAANYDPSSDLLGKREHVLRRAYDNLPETAQKLLSQLAAFRSGVSWQVLADVFGSGSAVQADLRLLEERGLLQRTIRRWEDGHTDTSYDLHPIVRRYAYDRLADQGETHGQLVIYFEAVPAPQRIHSLEDLALTIELYHHLTRAGRYDEAVELFRDRINRAAYYQLGAYHTHIELLLALFPDGEDKLPRLSEEADQAWTLNTLAASYSLAGRPSAAVPLFKQYIAISEKRDAKKNLAHGLAAISSFAHLPKGFLKTVAYNLCRSISLGRKIEDRFQEATGHVLYGRLLAATGNWDEAAQEFDTAWEQFKAEKHIQTQGVTLAYRAQAALLQGAAAAALPTAQEALWLADESARTRYPMERDYVRVHWLLGWAWLGLGELAAAQSHLDESLRRCRAINMVDHEPSILLAQARLVVVQGQVKASHTLAAEAQHIATRSGYVLDLADIYNFQAQLALDAGDTAAAGQLAQRAYDYAWCDGPPYAYQSALDEAERLLALVNDKG